MYRAKTRLIREGLIKLGGPKLGITGETDDSRTLQFASYVLGSLKPYSEPHIEDRQRALIYLDEVAELVRDQFPNFNDRMVPYGIINASREILMNPETPQEEMPGRITAVTRIASELVAVYRLRKEGSR